MTPRHPERDTDPALAALLESAYAQRVDVEVAARHLWVIHRASGAFRGQGRRTRKALVSVLAGGMLFMSSGGALAASSDALPGDVLYSVKRGVEQARIVLSVSREGDARLHLALAERRMAEAREAAAKRPEVVAKLVEDALDSIDTAERTGGTVVAMEVQEARSKTTEQLDVLVAVMDESAADLLSPRKIVTAQTEIAMVPTSPTPSESDAATPSASPSEDTSTLAAEASPTSEPEQTASASPSSSPSATSSPTASSSPSASASPSPTTSPSASASPSPSTSPTASPSEPTPTSSPSRKYESVDPTDAPSGTTTTAPAQPEATPTS